MVWSCFFISEDNLIGFDCFFDFFIVEDLYGQDEGVVTLEDAIETVLGSEIVDESDTVEDLQAFAKEEYRNRIREDKN